ncbi:hypothetical protein VTH06DRAFT_7475 [Thermothelomyces fergusii]
MVGTGIYTTARRPRLSGTPAATLSSPTSAPSLTPSSTTPTPASREAQRVLYLLVLQHTPTPPSSGGAGDEGKTTTTPAGPEATDGGAPATSAP